MELFHSVPPWNMEYHGMDSNVEENLEWNGMEFGIFHVEWTSRFDCMSSIVLWPQIHHHGGESGRIHVFNE